MTAPRQVLPGSTYMVSRRCAQRSFLLKPSDLSESIFRYVLAVAADRYEVELHVACVMSNHYHLIVTDPHANLPRFQQFLDGIVARAMNAVHGRWEAFWAPSTYSAVRLESPEDVLEKMAYALANPAAAGLVERASEWPGIWSGPGRIGAAPEVVARPEVFFSKKGSMPEEAELRFTPPPGCSSEDDLVRALVQRVTELEIVAAAKLEAQSRRFLGVSGVLDQKPTDRPSTPEPRRGMNPRIAARDKWKRIEALGRLKAFRLQYREALARLRKGFADVVFPKGTYLLRVQLNVTCALA